MVRAVSFDVGGTLIEPWPSVGEVYAAVAAEAGLGAFSPAQLETQFIEGWRSRGAFDYSREAWKEVVQASFRGLCPVEAVENLFPKIYRRFSDRDVWRIFPDVVPTLRALADRDLKLAITSNWDERLKPLLDELDLGQHFSVVAVSREVGHHKPSKEIFHWTCRELGLAPSEVLHVGDSLREDVRGANGAGLHTALIDRSLNGSTQTEWHTLEQCLGWLERLGA